MANANTPYGLQPVSYRSGAPYNGAARVYYVPVGNNTALFFGDPVNLVGNSADANGVPAVQIASAGSGHQVLGAFMGIANNAGELVIPVLQNQTPYLPASTAAYVYVTDDPTLLYKIQEDSSGGSMVVGAAGGNANLASGSGSTYTSFSGWQLHSSSLSQSGSDPTLQLRIIQALQEVDNSVGSGTLNGKWLVEVNTGVAALTNPNSGGS